MVPSGTTPNYKCYQRTVLTSLCLHEPSHICIQIEKYRIFHKQLLPYFNKPFATSPKKVRVYQSKRNNEKTNFPKKLFIDSWSRPSLLIAHTFCRYILCQQTYPLIVASSFPSQCHGGALLQPKSWKGPRSSFDLLQEWLL